MMAQGWSIVTKGLQVPPLPTARPATKLETRAGDHDMGQACRPRFGDPAQAW